MKRILRQDIMSAKNLLDWDGIKEEKIMGYYCFVTMIYYYKPDNAWVGIKL